MAKRRTRLFISVFACAMLFMCGALNCAYADDSSDDANSWRFFHGELVLSDSGASTDNLGTFEEAAADSADGVMACSVEANGNGWPVYNWFDQFNRGYCSGAGAYKGIDVSEWQGEINWAQVKTAGVDFAILRCGRTFLEDEKKPKRVDNYWYRNVEGCLSSGMPFGAFYYSQATSPAEASEEADWAIYALQSAGVKGSDLAFPVYFDMEDSKMVGKNYAAIAQAFFDKLTAAGYPVGTYANLSWWNTRLTSPVFDKYSKWVAAYNASIGLTYAPMSNFSEGNGVWQFSDYGSIPGISGRVDLNYTYMAPVNSDHWIKSESKWWYRYVDGSYPANCWAQIDGQWYHFDASGWMQTGWQMANGAWYYLGPSGAMQTGWLNDGAWYYLDPEAGGAMATGVKAVQGAAYFFDASGAMAAGWCADGGAWRYAAPSGALVSGWNVVNGSWYWFDGETYAMREGWLNDGGSWYWLADGGDGRMATGWQMANGAWYYLGPSGAMQTGWLNDGAWYYLDPEAGGAMATGVKAVQGAAYFFDASGAMAAGWCADGGAWRYAAPSGALVSGWNVVNGSWYWFDGETYAMREGWLNDGGSWYWLADGGDGRMATGWQQIGGSRYWLSDSGAMATGWCQIDGVYYFFNGSGAMEHDCWVGDYYLTSSGAMATDTWVGGYHVGADGKWDNR